MTRKFVDDIRAEINALLADNVTFEISPLDVRTCLLDMCDSLQQAEAQIYNTAAFNGVALTPTFQKLTTFNAGTADAEFSNNIAQGTITGNLVAGYSYIILGQLSVSGGNNNGIDITIGLNGTPLAAFTSDSMRGTNNPIGLSVAAYINSGPATPVITLMARTPEGNSNVDVSAAALFVEVLPTNNA